MEIINATPIRLTEILDIYARARKFMAEHGNPNQWTGNYPDPADLLADMQNKCLYLCIENGVIECVFKFITTPDPTYSYIKGAWKNDKPYGTIHRIASNGTVPRIADVVIQWCAARCESLRADTHRDNAIMQNVLTRNGFEYCGIIYLEDGDERLAYQLFREKAGQKAL